ncbi:uncharacterized protein LOC108905742 isoform X2 [Anoplophora glabripennis]|uniref:uncharacterized protein LOC108905742 isoform X2 n=1 Tax=Anoplophora glabripennis TaxID=217634 RepID=UPI0008745128|nr:uncharacterized protein LOC108905742 isoform X2 [Anoplophora glabripennis]
MQPYVILKRPGKAILYLFIIMLLFIVKESYGHDKCYWPCFGPVWKVKIYNELAKGYLHVEGNTVVANYTGDGTLYKISKGASFYLYDANAAKFICWSNRRNKKPALVARKYKFNSLGLCEFKDMVSTNHRNSHVHLLASFSKDRNKDRDVMMMKFNKNGRFSTKNCTQHKSRHQHKKCVSAADFLVIPALNANDDPCGCPEAKNYFCQTKLRNMPELHEICNLTWPRSNETYET